MTRAVNVVKDANVVIGEVVGNPATISCRSTTPRPEALRLKLSLDLPLEIFVWEAEQALSQSLCDFIRLIKCKGEII